MTFTGGYEKCSHRISICILNSKLHGLLLITVKWKMMCHDFLDMFSKCSSGTHDYSWAAVITIIKLN
jgi:hypothetical protein